MKNQNLRSSVNRTVATVALILLCVGACPAASEKILHNFSALPHGATPESNLIADAAGNLYGTTFGGGYGVVFEFTPASKGKWTETILYTFTGNPTSGPDGAYPAAGLLFDSAGNLYGTTSQGGIYGQGTVFKLTRTSGGKWKETVIHAFLGYPGDGANPLTGLVSDSAGNLFGTTSAGGNGGGCGDQYTQASCGTVFELSPVGNGWTETILHNFQGGTDGCFPAGGLIFDQSGSLYGTSQFGIGGGYDCFLGVGTVFKLTRGSGGTWTESVLYAFTGNGDGGNPAGALIFDSAGNLYGTGAPPSYLGSGTVFELNPGSGGTWTETVLYNLNGPSYSGLIFDKAGNLYGTIEYGGSSSCTQGCGSIFELSPGSGGWTETTLYSFTGSNDGAYPVASLLSDSAGNLYTTVSDGANRGCISNAGGCGAAVKLTPSSGGKWIVGAVYDFPSPKDGSSSRANLISDAAGNLYGTTTYGGTGRCGGPYPGCGTVFELSPTSAGNWRGRVLYTFTGASGDGANPVAGLVFDSTGNLYGTTQYGGQSNYGTVFELSPAPKGRWTETVIYGFSGNDGFGPVAGLIIDDAGSLYGTTEEGGNGGDVFQLVHSGGSWQENTLYAFNQGYPQGDLVLDKEGNLYGTTSGTVFKLSHGSSGWTETVLHTFNVSDGYNVRSTLTFDKQGSIYGTTVQGGIYNAGVVFKLTLGSRGVWTETVLHNFIGVNGDGAFPGSSLIFDTLGNLYGLTTVGGIDGGGCGGLGCGTAFELIPSSDGKWKERVLHRFTGGLDGGQPYAGFILDPAGDLYATASSGGAAGQGAVFKITQ
jgi:uncharacterized repeat protein (TIGR03803 family)